MDIEEPTQKKEFETVLPLVNIVFLLLIFFMLAGVFIKPDAFVIVAPVAKTDTDANQNDITILMNTDNQFAIDKSIYTKEELSAVVREIAVNKPNVTIQLKADSLVKSKDLISAMGILGDAGLSSIRLLTTLNHPPAS